MAKSRIDSTPKNARMPSVTAASNSLSTFQTGDRAGSLAQGIRQLGHGEVARTEKPHARRNAGCLSGRGGCARQYSGWCAKSVASRMLLKRLCEPTSIGCDRQVSNPPVSSRSRASWNALHHLDADHKKRSKGLRLRARACNLPHAELMVGQAHSVAQLHLAQVSPVSVGLTGRGSGAGDRGDLRGDGRLLVMCRGRQLLVNPGRKLGPLEALPGVADSTGRVHHLWDLVEQPLQSEEEDRGHASGGENGVGSGVVHRPLPSLSWVGSGGQAASIRTQRFGTRHLRRRGTRMFSGAAPGGPPCSKIQKCRSMYVGRAIQTALPTRLGCLAPRAHQVRTVLNASFRRPSARLMQYVCVCMYICEFSNLTDVNHTIG